MDRKEENKLYRMKNKEKLKQYRLKRKEIDKQWRLNNKEHLSDYMKKYRVDKAESIAEYNKKYKSDNKNHAKSIYLKRVYGIDLEQYNQMFTAQDGKCAICGQPETQLDEKGNIRSLCVDHNHKTGQVRQLLCTQHNLAVGNLDESIEDSIKLTEYLVKWNKGL